MKLFLLFFLITILLFSSCNNNSDLITEEDLIKSKDINTLFYYYLYSYNIENSNNKSLVLSKLKKIFPTFKQLAEKYINERDYNRAIAEIQKLLSIEDAEIKRYGLKLINKLGNSALEDAERFYKENNTLQAYNYFRLAEKCLDYPASISNSIINLRQSNLQEETKIKKSSIQRLSKNPSDKVKQLFLSEKEIIDKLKCNFVNINTYINNNSQKVKLSRGSGFIIKVQDNQSYIITNFHLIYNQGNMFTDKYYIADEVIISTLTSSKKYKGIIVSYSPAMDLAIVKVNEILSKTPLELAPSSNLELGERVFSLGSPYQFSNTLSQGYISSVNRNINYLQIEGLIQHDATIHPGCSGGPLLNQKGEVIGCNTLTIGKAENINFAIPSTTIKTLLMTLDKNNSIGNNWIGVVTDNNYEVDEGLTIKYVFPESPAFYADLHRYDKIISVNNITLKNINNIQNYLFRNSTPSVIHLKVKRQNELIDKWLILSIKPDNIFMNDEIMLPIFLGFDWELYPKEHHKRKVIFIEENEDAEQNGMKVGDYIDEFYNLILEGNPPYEGNINISSTEVNFNQKMRNLVKKYKGKNQVLLELVVKYHSIEKNQTQLKKFSTSLIRSDIL